MSGVQLAIDTATDRLSVAVRGADGVTHEAALEGARRHARDLVPLVDELLGRLDATAADIRLVALADGPGSFTGLRVGGAFAKALARDPAVSLWVAPSLLCRAASVGTPSTRVIAVSSALRGELYAGAWAFGPDGVITCLLPPAVHALGALRDLAAPDHVIGDGPEAVIEALASALGVPVIGAPRAWPSAAVLLGLLGRPGGAVAIREPAAWEPTYGRPAEAQAQWELRHGRPLPDSSSRSG